MHSTNNLPAACVIPVLRHYHSIAILKIIFSHTARSYIDVLFYPYHKLIATSKISPVYSKTESGYFLSLICCIAV